MICLEEGGKKKLRCEGTLLDTVSKRIQKSESALYASVCGKRKIPIEKLPLSCYNV